MKKLFSVLICVLMLCGMLLPVAADEAEDFQAEIGTIDCPFGAPAIDGNITEGEGWSAAQPINKANTDGGWGAIPVEVEGSLWRAYDSEYLYIAAEIILPEISLCEEEDWIDGDDVGNRPGWDGDVFVFTLDPLNKLRDVGFLSDTSVWYCFGIFEGDVIRTYRTHVNEGEVTDIISARGKLTDGGWLFEAAIPWETVCRDVEDISYGDVTLTPEEIVAQGNEVTCAMIYYDRRYDNEACERITYHRYVTIATTCVDGTSGIMATPWKINAYGIHLNLGALPTAEDTTTAADTTAGSDTTTAAEVTEVVTDGKGNAVTDDKGNKVTQKVTTKSTTKKATTGATTGGNAAQTFDIGAAMAVGVLAVSGIGFVAAKKRR